MEAPASTSLEKKELHGQYMTKEMQYTVLTLQWREDSRGWQNLNKMENLHKMSLFVISI